MPKPTGSTLRLSQTLGEFKLGIFNAETAVSDLAVANAKQTAAAKPTTPAPVSAPAPQQTNTFRRGYTCG
jgi:hypothetical protein